MLATLGADVAATLIAPGVLPAAQMGARIETPYTRAIQAYWRPAAYDPVSGLWSVLFPSADMPTVAGEYNLVWMTNDPDPPEMEVFIPLSLVTATGLALSGAPYPWAPTVEQVAAETPAYTRGGFDDDREEAGAVQGIFTEDTEPTHDEVATRIANACDEIAGRVGVGIPPGQYGLARAAAIQRVKASIAADKVPAGTEDAGGEYRGAVARYLANLETLTTNSRAGTAPRLH